MRRNRYMLKASELLAALKAQPNVELVMGGGSGFMRLAGTDRFHYGTLADGGQSSSASHVAFFALAKRKQIKLARTNAASAVWVLA